MDKAKKAINDYQDYYNIKNTSDLEKQIIDKQNQINEIQKAITKLNIQKEEENNILKEKIQQKKEMYINVYEVRRQRDKVIEQKNLNEKNRNNLIQKENNLLREHEIYNDNFQDYLSLKKKINKEIESLEKEKNTQREIEEIYYENELTSSKIKYLYCTKCKQNCHEDCDCNGDLFSVLYNPCYCSKINQDGTCKVCESKGCTYKDHNRDYNYYKLTQKKKKVNYFLSKDELKKINNKITNLNKEINKINSFNKKKKKILMI